MKLLAILMSALLAFATPTPVATETLSGCLLYTSDAADEL